MLVTCDLYDSSFQLHSPRSVGLKYWLQSFDYFIISKPTCMTDFSIVILFSRLFPGFSSVLL